MERVEVFTGYRENISYGRPLSTEKLHREAVQSPSLEDDPTTLNWIKL